MLFLKIPLADSFCMFSPHCYDLFKVKYLRWKPFSFPSWDIIKIYTFSFLKTGRMIAAIFFPSFYDFHSQFVFLFSTRKKRTGSAIYSRYFWLFTASSIFIFFFWYISQEMFKWNLIPVVSGKKKLFKIIPPCRNSYSLKAFDQTDCEIKRKKIKRDCIFILNFFRFVS